MDFTELKTLAEEKVKTTLRKYHSNGLDMGLKTFFQVLHCFEQPPKWLCEMLEFKATYELAFPDASFIFELIDIASFKDLFSPQFYSRMFSHMVSVLDNSRVEQVMSCLHIFQYVPEIKQLAKKTPELKDYLQSNLDQLHHRDLIACLKLFRYDAAFRNMCISVFINKLKTNPKSEVPLQDLIVMSHVALSQREFRRDFI